MWSKKPKPGAMGLRCKIHVQRDGEFVPCGRPAKRYSQQVHAHWQNGELLDVGSIDCCVVHTEKLYKQGVVLTRIDRRKAKSTI